MTTGLDAARGGWPGHPHAWAPTHLGLTADAERPGGQGMRISFAVDGCPLGRLLVGATERGISMVGLGRSDAALEASLRTEYPAAEIVRDARGIGGWVRDVRDHLEGRQPELELPTDVAGTDFERHVWDALRAIPYGSTRSYGEIARALGQPAASREVGQACATNPTAVVVPCHRVVHADGRLGGYRWGVWRKRDLLAREWARRQV